MLDFAVRLTQRPSSITRSDVEGLREAGFDDERILSIVLLPSLFNFMNRPADGLGVEVPPRTKGRRNGG
jgi:alkylhydroperoxidase family enzyme